VTQAFARVARDAVRRFIRAGEPLFDAGSPYYAVPEDTAPLAPSREAFELELTEYLRDAAHRDAL
jgi:hypothetical protein